MRLFQLTQSNAVVENPQRRDERCGSTVKKRVVSRKGDTRLDQMTLRPSENSFSSTTSYWLKAFMSVIYFDYDCVFGEGKHLRVTFAFRKRCHYDPTTCSCQHKDQLQCHWSMGAN